MNSLKDLRAENEARRLRRTEEGDAPAAITPNNGLGTVMSPKAATTGAPRVGRTLSPLASTSRQQAVSADGDFRRADDTEVAWRLGDENRESRKIRRRRRRERERGEDNDGDDDGPRASIEATAMARATSIKGVVEERKEDPAFLLSARGVPPQEKPRRPSPQEKPKLTTRRARIEQQKREEAEQKADVAQESQLGHPSTPPSDESAEQTTPTETSSSRSTNASQGKPANESPLERKTARALRRAIDVSQSPTNEENGAGDGPKPGGGKEGFPGREDKKGVEDDVLDPNAMRGVKGRDFGDNTDSAADVLSEKVEVAKADEIDDTAEGRFKTMRSRTRKASEEKMRKISSTDVRSKRPDESPRWAGGRSPDKATAGGMRASTEADSGEGDDGPYIANQNADAKQTGRALRGHQDNSDFTSGDRSSALSPRSSDAEGGHFDDGGAKIKHHSGRTEKWRKGEKRGLHDAAAIAGGDREVTLGHVVDRKMREMGYIRKPALDKLKNRRSWRDRVAAEGVPEVHFIGELSGAEGFGPGVSCRFRVEGGRHWTCLAGLEAGQTHVAHAGLSNSFCPWNHPLDLHYTTKSIQGWPRLMVQVWQLDTYGRNVLRGYGFRHLPSNPGSSAVSLPCWRPTGTMQEETAAFFLGVTPCLTTEDVIFNRAWDQRCRLVTLPAGTVWIEVNVLFRNLQDQDVDSLLYGYQSVPRRA